MHPESRSPNSTLLLCCHNIRKSRTRGNQKKKISPRTPNQPPISSFPRPLSLSSSQRPFASRNPVRLSPSRKMGPQSSVPRIPEEKRGTLAGNPSICLQACICMNESVKKCPLFEEAEHQDFFISVSARLPDCILKVVLECGSARLRIDSLSVSREGRKARIGIRSRSE